MAKLKIRFELNKGGAGISFAKLVAIAGEAHRFLDMLAEDVGIKSPQWVAKDFANNSVDFNCECLVEDELTEKRGFGAVKAIIQGKHDDAEYGHIIRPATWRQFAEILRPIDPDEKVGIGVFNGGSVPKMEFISRDRFSDELEVRPKTARYYGQIQGIVHAFYKESEQPKLVVRELSTKELVDCYFNKQDPDMYHAAVDLLQDPDAIVFVEGDIEENRDTGIVKSIRVKDFQPAPKFNLIKFQGSVGTFTKLTGDMTTEKFIDDIREGGDDSKNLH